MANAKIDGNGTPTLIGTLDSDGTTIVRVKVNVSSNNSLKVVDSNTGTDHGLARALRDENSHPVLLAVSSADGVSIVPVYADTNGNLLIQST